MACSADHAILTGDSQDRWLDRWLPRLRSAVGDGHVLELGCDDGRDTATLVQAGFGVIATDISLEALGSCATLVPAARLLHHDLRTPMPFADGEFAAILASLCLHYFEWTETQAMVDEIHRCLRPGGLLLCRLNSTHDFNFGARGHQMLEDNYYAISQRFGERKRFFDRPALDKLFGTGWEPISVQEMTIARYELPKVVWEAVLLRRHS